MKKPNEMNAPGKVTFALQIATACAAELPPRAQIRDWTRAALMRAGRGGELTVRVVDEEEMAALNRKYRNRDGATDVLAFAFDGGELPRHARAEILGDVVVCAPVAAAHAARAHCALHDHFAHLVVHGTLHLCGYDHKLAAPAARMQALERDILTACGVTPPAEATIDGVTSDSAGIHFTPPAHD